MEPTPDTASHSAVAAQPVVRSVSLIMNEASGSSNKSELRRQIEQAFEERGVKVHILPLQAAGGIRRVQRLVEHAEGRLAVAGGDGTINAVASACRRIDRSLGLVPAGTFNYVARNLGLPTTVPEAVDVIVHGRPTPVPAGDINGHLFLNNAGLGLYAQIIEQREADKNRFGRKRIVAFLSGMRKLMQRHPRYHLSMRVDGEDLALRTTAVFFGVNALQLENYNVEAAQCVKQGELAVLSLHLESRWDIAGAAWASLTGKTEAAQCVDAVCARSISVRSGRRRFKVALDGEVIHLRPPLRVRHVAGAIRIIMTDRNVDAARTT